eukprot:6513467-Alexandrium_andersonii.AAC.1
MRCVLLVEGGDGVRRATASWRASAGLDHGASGDEGRGGVLPGTLPAPLSGEGYASRRALPVLL